jgi:hypothetical protein
VQKNSVVFRFYECRIALCAARKRFGKKQAIRKKIVFDYSKVQFRSDGAVAFLELYVNCKDGYNGSASNEKDLKPDSKFGFIRN